MTELVEVLEMAQAIATLADRAIVSGEQIWDKVGSLSQRIRKIFKTVTGRLQYKYTPLLVARKVVDLPWIDYKVFTIYLGWLDQLDISERQDRDAGRNLCDLINRTYLLNVAVRFPANATAVSVFLPPLLKPYLNIQRCLASYRTIASPDVEREIQLLYKSSLLEIYDLMRDGSSVFDRNAFELKFDLKWEGN